MVADRRCCPVAQRLQELETLRASGVISDAEYTAKRGQIIDELRSACAWGRWPTPRPAPDTNDVVMSSTLRDLVIGSGLELGDRGAHELNGVPGEWRLFSIDSAEIRERPLETWRVVVVIDGWSQREVVAAQWFSGQAGFLVLSAFGGDARSAVFGPGAATLGHHGGAFGAALFG